ncbi:hypothetical protein E4T39_05457 [Aureobasidium subglaciale]|nr:hypothetical protein E4T39_05457 [Aureobasidium subglaciale]
MVRVCSGVCSRWKLPVSTRLCPVNKPVICQGLSILGVIHGAISQTRQSLRRNTPTPFIQHLGSKTALSENSSLIAV